MFHDHVLKLVLRLFGISSVGHLVAHEVLGVVFVVLGHLTHLLLVEDRSAHNTVLLYNLEVVVRHRLLLRLLLEGLMELLGEVLLVLIADELGVGVLLLGVEIVLLLLVLWLVLIHKEVELRLLGGFRNVRMLFVGEVCLLILLLLDLDLRVAYVLVELHVALLLRA